MATSDLFGWQYELDPAAPALATMDDIRATADAYNGTINFELVEGSLTLVEQISKKQVASLDPEIDAWARAAYPAPRPSPT